jgi:hypothetical protein
MVKVAKAPIMYKEPCAIFGTRSTPRTKLNPAQTINKIIDRLRPTKNWLLRAEISILWGYPFSTTLKINLPSRKGRGFTLTPPIKGEGGWIIFKIFIFHVPS